MDNAPEGVKTTPDEVEAIARHAIRRGRKEPGWPRTMKLALTGIYHIYDNDSVMAAGLRAGYAHNSARSGVIHRSLADCEPFLQMLRESKEHAARKALEVTPERIMKGLAALAFFDLSELYREVVLEDGKTRQIGRPLSELSERTRMAVQSVRAGETVKLQDGTEAVDYRYTWYSRAVALERLGRHAGLFNEKLQAQRAFERQQRQRSLERDFSHADTEDLRAALEQVRRLRRKPDVVDGEYSEVD